MFITLKVKSFIKIYYNSISSLENADLNDINYGPLEEPKKFLPKNITELRNDGGEISLINVIIVKKYDYYINNLTKKIRYSRKKFENEIVKIPESSEKKNYNALDNDQKNNMNSNNNEIKEQLATGKYNKIQVTYLANACEKDGAVLSELDKGIKLLLPYYEFIMN